MKLIPKQSFGVSSSQYMFKKKHELKEVKEYSKLFSEVRNEISKVVVGQEKVIEEVKDYKLPEKKEERVEFMRKTRLEIDKNKKLVKIAAEVKSLCSKFPFYPE